MFAKGFLNVVSLLTVVSISGIAFAGSQQKSPYVDDEGYCVVDIHSSNQIKYVQQQVINVPDAEGHVVRTNDQFKYVQQKVINVPDIKGHVVRIYEQEQKLSNTKLCNGDSLVLKKVYAMTDYIDHDGSKQGYVIFITAKGDQLFLKYTGNSQKKAGEDLSDSQDTGRIIGGEGSLAAIEGDYQYVGKFNRHKEIIKPIMNKLRYKNVDKDAKK